MIIAITGLAGSGKTTSCSYFNKLGKDINIIDADKLGHGLLNNKTIKNKLIKIFGKDIINKNKINRNKVNKIVFKNKNNLTKLNKIVHPLLIKKIKNKIRKDKLNVIDAALYHELKLKKISDKIILIKCNKNNILERNKKIKNIKNILKLQKEINIFDYKIDNNGNKNYLKTQVTNTYNKIMNIKFKIKKGNKK